MKKYELRFIDKNTFRRGSIDIFAKDEEEALYIAEMNKNLIVLQVLEIIYES